MSKPHPTLNLWVYSTFIFIALVIVTDFVLPGKVYVDEIIDIQAAHQQYYNAGGNYHYSYRVFTRTHNFSVSEEFVETVQNNQKIKYTVSQIFSEVNRYGLLTSDSKNIYSLRILSGLIIPLMVMVTMGVAYQSKKKMSNFIFVIQVVLIVDLIFLIV